MSTNIPSSMAKVFEEETDQLSSISEALLQKLGASINALIDAKLANDTDITDLQAQTAASTGVTLVGSFTGTASIAGMSDADGGDSRVERAVYIDVDDSTEKYRIVAAQNGIIAPISTSTIDYASNRFATIHGRVNGGTGNYIFTCKIWEVNSV